MEFHETDIEGVFRIEITRFSDDRGFFARVWCEDEFEEAGLSLRWVQANVGFSPRVGTLRGLHYQGPPFREAKLLRCTRGAIFDVAVDLRPDSPTYRKWAGATLSADNHTTLYVPPGCAHGYLTLEDDTELFYLASERYSPATASGVRFDDPSFGIQWPSGIETVSERDRNWPLWPISGENVN